jgi:hypothetical protein
MKKIKLVLITIFIHSFLSVFGQVDTNLNIEYGAFKTEYQKNGSIISKKEFKSQIQTNDIAFSEFKKGRRKIAVGNIIGLPSILLLVITIENANNNNTPYPWMWAGGIGGSAIGIGLYYWGRQNTINAVQIYNNKKIGLNIINRGNSFGLSLNF